MARTTHLWWLLLCAWLVGCSGDGIVWNGSDGGDIATTDALASDGGAPDDSLDAGASDADGGVMDATDAVPLGRLCPDDRFCPAGQRCLGGHCEADPCLGADNTCGADSCLARCVWVRDPCAGITCHPNETCTDGQCVAGCFPTPCAGVTCPAGQYCDSGTGMCTALHPCGAMCPDGAACDIQCI